MPWLSQQEQKIRTSIGNENFIDFHINIMLNFRLPIQNVNATTYLVPELHAGMLV